MNNANNSDTNHVRMHVSSDAKLCDLRTQVSKLDSQIVALLCERANIAKQIGNVKRTIHTKSGSVQKSMALYDPARESQVLRNIASMVKGELQEQQLCAIYREIISACLQLQCEQRVVYLGPEGTFTHMAALHHFGSSAHLSYRSSILDIFRALDMEACDYAVAPIENSTEGMVSQTIDMLGGRDLRIMGELELPVRHCLLATTDIDLAAIQEVYAHEQALAQCQHWLNDNVPRAQLCKQPSNAVAIQIVKNRDHAVAVGGEINAKIHDLCIVRRNIEDVLGNKTRFVVIGRETVSRTGQDKTAVLFAVRHKPGTLYRALKSFADRDVDLTRLESRPVKTASWSYSFFVEMRGHIEDTNVKEAIDALEPECTLVHFLGSYPAKL